MFKGNDKNNDIFKKLETAFYELYPDMKDDEKGKTKQDDYVSLNPDDIEELLNDLNDESDDTNEGFGNIFVFNDENGNEVKFEFLDLIEYKGEEFVVLLPEEDGDEAGEVIILKVTEGETEDEEFYVSVDDDDTLMAVFNIFREEFEDRFNFVDEE